MPQSDTPSSQSSKKSPSPANVKTIARAASLVMVFFIASRGLGLLRDVVIAAQFGTSPALEAYLAAFRIPDLLFNVMAGGALGSAFIPTYSDYLSRDDQKGAWRLASAILNWLLLITLGISLLAAIFAYPLANTLVPEFSLAQKALTASLMRGLLVSTVIFGVSGLIMGILNAHQHFLSPALAPVLYNLAIILGALGLGPIWGVYGLVIGIVGGALAHLLVQLPALHHYGLRYLPILIPRDPGVREVARLMGPRMLGLGAVQLNFMWDAYLASGLTQGSYAGLDYGRRLMLLPQGIIAQAVAAAAFPTFSALASQKDWANLQTALTATLRSILYLTVPASIGLILLGRPIIQVFYQRSAFDETSTSLTLWALWFYTVGLVAHSVVEILARAFYALHNTKTPVLAGIMAMVVNIFLSLLLMSVFLNANLAAHGGIALASSIAIMGEMIWLMWMLRKQAGQLSLWPLAKPLGRILGAGAVMTLVLFGLRLLTVGLSPWLIVPLGIVVGGGVYGGVTYWLGSEEPKLIINKIRARFL